MSEKKAPKDIALDVPAEANREKHINFLEEESTGTQETDDQEETAMKNPKPADRNDSGKDRRLSG